MWMWVIVGSTRVSSAPSRSVSSILDVAGTAADCRAAATSSGVCPTAAGPVDRVDDLRIEVEPQVVAGGEVGQPLVADADPPALDLVDHRVVHRVSSAQPLEVGPLDVLGRKEVRGATVIAKS